MRHVHAGASARRCASRLAALIAEAAPRVCPVYAVVLAAADTDPEIAELARTLDEQRLAGATQLAATVVRAPRATTTRPAWPRCATRSGRSTPRCSTGCWLSGGGRRSATGTGSPAPSPRSCCEIARPRRDLDSPPWRGGSGTSDIAEVRDRTRIDEVVGEYVALRRAGAGSLKGLCPFHDEKTPSFNVRPSHGTFHCFGCGEGGDVIAFIMKIEVIGLRRGRRAARRPGRVPAHLRGRRQLGAARPGHPLPAARGQQAGRGVLRRAAAHAGGARRLSSSSPAAGSTPRAAAQFGCGYAPAGWDALTKHLLGGGFSLDELMKAGLSKEGRRGPIDRFHRRLLWPIRDLGGDVVGFGARRLFDDDGIEAKYLNTTDTPVYRKSQVLFGLDLAKREIAKRRQVVVVEGYTDVMAMHLAGVPTAVASCGTAFGAEHVAVIRRLIGDDSFDLGEVIYTFDGDAAGQAAALKAFEGDQAFAAQTFVAIAPDGQDPCELRQADGDTAVRDLVARREPLFEFAIRSHAARPRPRHRGGPGRRAAAHGAAGGPDQARGPARRVRAPARRLDQLGRHRDGRAPGAGDRRRAGRAPRAGRARREPRRRAAARTTRGCTCSARRSRRPCRCPPSPARATTSCPSRSSPTRRSPRCTARCRPRAGCAAAATGTRGWRRCVAECPRGDAPAGHRAGRGAAGAAAGATPTRPATSRSVIAGVRLALVEAQVAELKSRLQRTNPVEEPDAYHQLFGDLVPLEQYRIALREKAMGGVR